MTADSFLALSQGDQKEIANNVGGSNVDAIIVMNTSYDIPDGSEVSLHCLLSFCALIC